MSDRSVAAPVSRLRRRLALLAGLLAVGLLIVGGWAAAQFRSATLGRPWFVAPSQLVVAEDGTLYVGIGGTEVQVYARDGTPRSAWYTTSPGPFRLRRPTEGGDGIEVVSASDRIAVFDADGASRGEREEPGAFARLGEPRREGTAIDGARFALRPTGLVRVTPGPMRVLVPAPPRPLAWFGTRPLLPITWALLSALLGMVACVVLSRRKASAR